MGARQLLGMPLAERNLVSLLARAHSCSDLRVAAADVSDWLAVWNAAVRNGVDGVILYYLTRASVELPDEVRAFAGRQAAYQQIWQSQIEMVLRRAHESLAAAGIRYVVLKGPILAERLYPSPSLRTSVDLDLLVGRADLARTIEALRTADFQYAHSEVNAYHLVHHHHITVEHHSGITLELHFRAHSGLGTLVPSEPFLERAQPYRTEGGLDVNVLSPEDEMIFLMAHAARHYDADLLWLYDIVLLLEKNPEIAWEVVAKRTREYSLTRAVALICKDLERIFGLAAPPLSLRLSRPRAALVHFARFVRRTGSTRSRRGRVAALVFAAVLSDSWGRAAASFGRNGRRIVRRRLGLSGLEDGHAGPPMGALDPPRARS